MKRDAADMLMQIAFLESGFTTHGAYEKAVARRTPGIVREESRTALLERLKKAVGSRPVHRDLPATLGLFLRNARSERGVAQGDVSATLGLPVKIYRLLEQDRISPLKVPRLSLKRLQERFDLSLEALAVMIRRTHQLIWYRPSFRTTLARYDPTKAGGPKAREIREAETEMFARAQLPIPEKEAAKIDALLRELSDQLQCDGAGGSTKK